MAACRGRSGKPCAQRCPSFQGSRDKCSHCQHKAKHHEPRKAEKPVPDAPKSIRSILESYGKTIQAAKSSDTAARKETSAGFRPKKETKAAAGPSRAHIEAAPVESITVGGIQLIPCGLNAGGEPNNPSATDADKEFESAIKLGLAVASQADKKITFASGMRQPSVDNLFRAKFPAAFTVLDHLYPKNAPPELQWVLVKKIQRKLQAVVRDEITGEELSQYMTTPNSHRGALSSRLRIVTKGRIPEAIWQDLGAAVETIESGGRLELVADAKPVRQRAAPRRNVKGKAKVVVSDSESAESLEDGSGAEDFSGAEEGSEAELHGIKRRASAELVPGPIAKRTRSVSAKSAPVSDTSSIRSISPPTTLRPVTSSFTYDPAHNAANTIDDDDIDVMQSLDDFGASSAGPSTAVTRTEAIRPPGARRALQWAPASPENVLKLPGGHVSIWD
uniref:Uncharacterized protein n=1 Tax=Mycena chlorophos TaxID=658473 RepID=A0ABQ0L0V1_MYCCL|nr:predicted protein [Mycena chlorophos]